MYNSSIDNISPVESNKFDELGVIIPRSNKSNWNDKYGRFVVLTESDLPWFSNPDNIPIESDNNKQDKNNKKIINNSISKIQPIGHRIRNNFYHIMSCLLIFIIVLQLIFI
jgi:hypothetical protein